MANSFTETMIGKFMINCGMYNCEEFLDEGEHEDVEAERIPDTLITESSIGSIGTRSLIDYFLAVIHILN